ncbi:hypothetical protein PROFUN_11903 [Planoprotostelium fungivorum]|uniref:Fido domain-containing protein n=1 Tax=Planoprotostelium fungivorum TaxID=1890364 RepID=A0A2P6MNS6_9EUKA|nr:hypothetical protein PROFUN_16804 [Planoprotostelium fungivorum]PRP80448.1 hypothetical protein PROFUN_11903 [Planoprotostelium fungivorum]
MLVGQRINDYVYAVDKLLKKTEMTDGTDRVLKTFAIAAFAQFHFVDLHPFVDGNSRICCFISKRIIDHVCPVPFPMFRDRRKYINALQQARTFQDPIEAPKTLCSLLLSEAIDHYTEMIWEISETKIPIYLSAYTVQQLHSRIIESSEDSLLLMYSPQV